jgi:leucyl-tRNA synthetase
MMSEEYNPHEIEARWRAHWDATRRDQFDLDGVSRPFYELMEFPYPSGEPSILSHLIARSAG